MTSSPSLSPLSKILPRCITAALAILLLLPFSGCRSKKEIVTPTDPATLATRSHVERVNYNRLPATGVRAKLDFSLFRGKNKISVAGRLRMKRDDIIQVSIMPHGLVEIGILELTPDYLMVVDKWGKQYVKAKWSEVKALERANIDFYAFQALFWEELFVPGRKDQAAVEDFDVNELGDIMRLQPTTTAATQKDAQLAFIARTFSGLIQQTVVTMPENSDLRFEWNYSNWVNFEGKDFPSLMTANIDAGSNNIKATLKISGLQSDPDMKDLRTKLNSGRYHKVDMERILSRIMTL